MTQPVIDVAAAAPVTATQPINIHSQPFSLPDLGSVNLFNEILAGSIAGGNEVQAEFKSLRKKSLIDPDTLAQLQKFMAKYSIGVEMDTKILAMLSTGLNKLVNMQ